MNGLAADLVEKVTQKKKAVKSAGHFCKIPTSQYPAIKKLFIYFPHATQKTRAEAVKVFAEAYDCSDTLINSILRS